MQEFETTLCSIVMPAYNSERSISRAINSVLRQENAEWELVICDDCSSDRTAQIVEEFQSRDSRIRLIQLTANQGPAIARNTAIASTSGRWLFFLDSDDYWLPQKLGKSIEFAMRTGSAMVFGSFQFERSGWPLRPVVIPVPDELTYEECLRGNQIATSSVVIDRNVLSSFSFPESSAPEDYSAWIRILKSGLVARGMQDSLVVYSRNSKSDSSNKFKMAFRVLKILWREKGPNLARVAVLFLIYVWRGIVKHLRF